MMLILFFCSAPVVGQPANTSANGNDNDEVNRGRALLSHGDFEQAWRVFTMLPQDAETYYYLGLVYQKKHLPDVAAEFIRAATALEPGRIAWRLKLAEIYELQNMMERARDEYRSILKQAGKDTTAGRLAKKKLSYFKATTYAKTGNIAEAFRLFSELASQYPEDILIVYSYGVAAMLSNHFTEAEQSFREVLHLNPDYLNAYLNLATLYERNGKISQAADILQKIIDQYPNSKAAEQAEIRLNLIEVRLLLDEGNLRDALTLIENILLVEPNNMLALTLAAGIYQQTGAVDKEEEMQNRILQLKPENPAALERLAGIYATTGRLREAFGALDKLLRLGEDSPYKAQAAAMLKKLLSTDAGQLVAEEITQERITRYQKKIRKDPADLDAHRELATIYLQRREPEKAGRELASVVRLDPQNRQAYVTLASIDDNLGKFQEAMVAYSRALSLTSDEQQVQRLVTSLMLVTAKNLYVNGRFEQSIREFSEVLKNNPDNTLAHFYMGLIYSSEEEPVKAADAYQQVLRLLPSHLGARLNLAASYEKMNREEDAIAEYNKILQANPSTDLAQAVRSRLKNFEKRVNGVVANFGYTASYDDNTNLSDTDEVADFRSNLTLSLAFQHKMKNGVRWRFSTVPSYEVFHQGQFDFLNTNSTLSATYIPHNITLVGGYTYRTSLGLITGSGFSRSNIFFADGFSHIKLPPLMHPWSGVRVFTGLSANVSYTDFEADKSPFFSAYTTSLGVSANQPLSRLSSINAGYNFVSNNNKKLIGSDYAYISHGINIGLQRRLPLDFIASAAYRWTLFKYKHEDSFSLFSKKRKNTLQNISLSLSRRIMQNINLFASVSWTQNKSNLPVGFILTPEDIIQGQQSSSLSDYKRLILSAGMNVNF